MAKKTKVATKATEFAKPTPASKKEILAKAFKKPDEVPTAKKPPKVKADKNLVANGKSKPTKKISPEESSESSSEGEEEKSKAMQVKARAMSASDSSEEEAKPAPKATTAKPSAKSALVTPFSGKTVATSSSEDDSDDDSDSSEEDDAPPKTAPPQKAAPTKSALKKSGGDSKSLKPAAPAPSKTKPAPSKVAPSTKKVASPESSESSDSDSDESDAPTATRLNGTAKAIESSDSSDDSDSESDQPSKAAKAAPPKTVGAIKDESSDDGDSSSDEDEKPVVSAAKKPASSHSSSDDSDSSEDENGDVNMADASVKPAHKKTEPKPAASAGTKRKAEDEGNSQAKKTKLASGAAAHTDAAGDQPLTTIFVGRLSWSVDNDRLAQEFAHCGDVESATVQTDRDTGKSRGFGYVRFKTADAVEKALALNGMEIDGRAVNIDRGNPPDRNKGREQRAKTFGDQISPPSSVLFVGNISFSTTEDGLWSFFNEHGVKSVRLPTDRDTGRPKGYGYVEFEDISGAKKAFEASQGAEIDGRSLRLDYSQPRDGPGGGRGGGRGFGRGRGFGERGGRGGDRGGRGGGDRGGRGGGWRGGGDRGGYGGRGGRGGGARRGGIPAPEGKKITF